MSEANNTYIGFEIPLETVNVFLILERKILNSLQNCNESIEFFSLENVFIPFFNFGNISVEIIELFDFLIKSATENMSPLKVSLKGIEFHKREDKTNILSIKLDYEESEVLKIKNLIEQSAEKIGLVAEETYLPLKILLLSSKDDFVVEKLKDLLDNYKDLVNDKFLLQSFILCQYLTKKEKFEIIKRYFIKNI